METIHLNGQDGPGPVRIFPNSNMETLLLLWFNSGLNLMDVGVGPEPPASDILYHSVPLSPAFVPPPTTSGRTRQFPARFFAKFPYTCSSYAHSDSEGLSHCQLYSLTCTYYSWTSWTCTSGNPDRSKAECGCRSTKVSLPTGPGTSTASTDPWGSRFQFLVWQVYPRVHAGTCISRIFYLFNNFQSSIYKLVYTMCSNMWLCLYTGHIVTPSALNHNISVNIDTHCRTMGTAQWHRTTTTTTTTTRYERIMQWGPKRETL